MSISTLLVKEMGGTPFPCHIIEYMRTIIFRVPSYYVQGGHIAPCVVKETKDFKASVVTNPVSYVLGDDFSDQQFVDGSFEATLRKTCEEDENKVEKTVFVVIQFEEDLGSFSAVKGQCVVFKFEGTEIYKVFDCSGAPAPNPDDRIENINVVLTAVKAELEVTDAITKAFDTSCYKTKEGQCIFKGELKASAHLTKVSPISLDDLTAKSLTIGILVAKIEKGIERDRIESLKPEVDDYGTRLKELVEALQLDPSWDSAYRRLWYLQLWDRVNEFRRLFARRQRPPELRNNSMEDVNNHRHSIAHRRVDRLDGAMFSSLQKKVFAYFKQHL